MTSVAIVQKLWNYEAKGQVFNVRLCTLPADLTLIT